MNEEGDDDDDDVEDVHDVVYCSNDNDTKSAETNRRTDA